MKTTVTNYYLEIEYENLWGPKENDFSFRCKCGTLILKRGSLSEKDFGLQRFCDCGNLIYTVSKKIMWTEYISGKKDETK